MSRNEITIVDKMGLKKPGDKMFARITSKGRQVLKVETNGGTNKYSATRYKNGTIVETKTTKTP